MFFFSIKPLPSGLLHMDVVSMSKLSNSISSPFMQLLCLARRVGAQEAAFPLFIYPDASSSADRDLEHPRTRPALPRPAVLYTHKQGRSYFLST